MPVTTSRRVLNVFLASPGDVAEERREAEELIDDLNKMIGRQLGWQIDLHKWEDMPPGYGAPQSRINPDVDTCDLFIGILCERWGQPTTLYSSGFEEEFERARKRRRDTGEPEIWMVFKDPQPNLLRDPGPELSRVLKFREGLKASGEVHFSTVATTAEWTRKLHTWMDRYILSLSRTELTPPQSVPPPATESPESAGSLSSVADSGDSEVPQQLKSLSASVAKVIQSGEMEFEGSDAKVLSEFDVARLYLLSATWMARRNTGEFIGIHEINVLYKYREKLEVTEGEELQLLRTLLHDEAGVAPGWFWISRFAPDILSKLLLSFAWSDRSAELRARVLSIMTAARVKLPAEAWPSLPLSDAADNVIQQALLYLGSIGDERALPLIDKVDKRPSVTEALLSAKINILLRSEPDGAFRELLSAPQSPSRELVGAFFDKAPGVSSPYLLKGIEDPREKIRELSVRELARRGELTADLANTLRDDASSEVREIALQEIVNTRGEPEIEKLRKAQSDERPASSASLGFLALAGTRRVDIEEIARNYWRTVPFDRLQEKIDWVSTDGPYAYEALAVNHFESFGETLRSDLENQFERVREHYVEGIRAEFGPDNASRIFQQLNMSQIDDYIRSQYAKAALTGLARHAESSDIRIARKYLSDRDGAVRLQAVKIISRFGGAEDVEALLSTAREGGRDLRELATAAAIRLSQNPAALALDILKTGAVPGDQATFDYLLTQDSREIRDYFRGLLGSQGATSRARAAYYLSKKLTDTELTKLLDDYITGGYYYDVVTWFDRVLYAPPPLQEMYTREMEQEL